MASTMANMVSKLMVKPAASSTPKVPSSTTGTASVGMMVARTLCKNSSMTRNTSTMASTRVLTTESIDTCTTGAVSYG